MVGVLSGPEAQRLRGGVVTKLKGRANRWPRWEGGQGDKRLVFTRKGYHKKKNPSGNKEQNETVGGGCHAKREGARRIGKRSGLGDKGRLCGGNSRGNERKGH